MSVMSQASQLRFEQDRKDLEKYVRYESQAAFAAIVRRHLPFVYATCLRALGNADLAQDATQVVFLILARKAVGLHNGRVLASWLFQTARLVARDLQKKERRRLHREQAAFQQMEIPNSYRESVWMQAEPLLNEALAILNATERDAVLLRFIEGKSLKETGAALGLTEGAANMRISRALQKMRRHMNREGAMLSLPILALLIAESTARSAPALPVALHALTGEGATSAIVSLLADSSLNRLAGKVEQTMKWLYWKSVTVVTVTAAVCFIAATAVHSRSVPTGRQAFAGVGNPAMAPLDAANLTVPESLAGLTLPDNCTLTFAVRFRNVRTPEMVDALVDSLRQNWLVSVRDGRATQQEADRAIAFYREGLENETKEKQYHITLSTQDGKLLLLADNATPAGTYVPQLYVYDGEKELTLQTWPHATPDHAEIHPGMWLFDMRDVMPLPGVGLSTLPLLKLPVTQTARPLGSAITSMVGRLPNLESSWVRNAATTRYFPGTLQARLIKGVPQALRVEEKTPTGGGTKWEYSRHQLFQGVWLAGRSIRTGYINASDFANNRPATILEFELESARATSLPADRFTIENYLTPGKTVIQWYANGGDVNPPHFVYDPQQGSLEAQAERERAIANSNAGH